MTQTIKVVGAAIIRDDRVLAARRSTSMSMPGKWEFPGGKLEYGERPEESLVREIEEELAVQVKVGASVGVGTSIHNGRLIELEVFICNLVSGEPEPREHAKLAWVTADELATLDWADADIPIAQRLAEMMREGAV